MPTVDSPPFLVIHTAAPAGGRRPPQFISQLMRVPARRTDICCSMNGQGREPTHMCCRMARDDASAPAKPWLCGDICTLGSAGITVVDEILDQPQRFIGHQETQSRAKQNLCFPPKKGETGICRLVVRLEVRVAAPTTAKLAVLWTIILIFPMATIAYGCGRHYLLAGNLHGESHGLLPCHDTNRGLPTSIEYRRKIAKHEKPKCFWGNCSGTHRPASQCMWLHDAKQRTQRHSYGRQDCFVHSV